MLITAADGGAAPDLPEGTAQELQDIKKSVGIGALVVVIWTTCVDLVPAVIHILMDMVYAGMSVLGFAP